MTDFDRDRGAYAPSGEAPLAFDARDPNGRGDGGGRPPTTLIISAAVLLVLVLALVFYYRSGVRHSGEPPVVGQPLSSIKQAPPASSQPADEAAGLSIYSAEQNPAAASPPPTFTPPPEQPKARPTAPTVTAQPAPAARPSTSASAPAPTIESLASAAATSTTPTLRPAPAVAPAPPTPAPAAAASPAAPGLLVQIGAYSSPALADKGWNDVARLLPGQMVGRTKRVEPVPKGSDTLYRAYIGGFGDKAEAVAFCADLKAAGHACFVK